MYLLVLLLLSPAVICAQRYRKNTNPNDEPFLPIHPEYPYSPKLMKRGIDQQQQQPQLLAQLTPELYAPKVDARDSYSASYSPNSYYPSYDSYTKSSTTQNALATSPFYQQSYSGYNANPYNLLNSYGTNYGSLASSYGANNPSYPATPYPATGNYPYPYYYPPYYYPNYYNQPPYPPPPGYPSTSSKHHHDDEDDDDDDKREKSKKSGSQKNKLRNSDRDSANNQYVDGANYIISSAKDLDGESSTHRTPSHYNQIEDSDVQPRTATLPKTYRLVNVYGHQPATDYNSTPNGYIKIQQLEQLMRQALSKLLAQNVAQQAQLAQIQQEASQQQSNKDTQQYIAIPNTIAKTGLSYVLNPTILNRVNPGQYNPSQLIQSPTVVGASKQTYSQKPATSVSLQQSPGIYIPPGASGNNQSSPDYGDYDSSESVTTRSQPSVSNYQATAEPTQARNNYPYSTYRPTQQTSLEDVNFGTKQKTKS